MCIDPKLEYCKNFNCEKHFECHAIFKKANEERHKINLLVHNNRADKFCKMRVKPESVLRKNTKLVW